MNLIIWIEAAGWTLAHFLWQGAAVALGLVALRWMTRNPIVRYRAGVASLAVLVLGAGLTFVRESGIRAPMSGKAGDFRPGAMAFVAASGNGSAADPAIREMAGVAKVAEAESETRFGWQSWAVSVWVLGMAFFGVRLALDWRATQRLRRLASSLPGGSAWGERFARLGLRMGAPKSARLLSSTEVRVPLALGILRPVVIVPAAMLAQLSPTQVEAILLHELAHLRRHDYFVNVLQTLAEMVFFFHPAVWWISRTIRDEREHCCDDLASAASDDVVEYAGALAALEILRGDSGAALVGMAADGGKPGGLLARVRRLTGGTDQSRWGGRCTWISAVAGGFAVGAVAMLATFLISEAADEESKPSGEKSETSSESVVASTADLVRPLAFEEHRVRQWVDAALRLDDEEAKRAALAEVRESIAAGEPGKVLAGLEAFVRLGEVAFDKAAFHDLFPPLLSSEHAEIRARAAIALLLSGATDDDRVRFLKLAADPSPEVRTRAAHVISFGFDHDLTGEASPAIVSLLEESDTGVLREVLRPLWGAKFSPAIEARVIELSRSEDPRISHDALYYALSTQANKSSDSIERLIEFLAHPDSTNVAGRAAWGLGGGVPEDLEGRVAEAALEVMRSRSQGGYVFRQSVSRLAQYAGTDQVEEIRAFLELPAIGDELRKELTKVLDRIDQEKALKARVGEKIVVSLTRSGKVRFEGREIGVGEYLIRVGAVGSHPDRAIEFRAPKDTDFDRIVEALDAIKKQGFWNVSFALAEAAP